MKADKKHSNKTKYLIVIAILCLSFSVAFILRAYPIKYGFYLNEFDPFFDYRATQYIVNNGIESYFNWHDNMSWFPEGRDIPGTSQSGLHITAAILYKIFGMNMSLMDFTIWFPVVIGSASTVLMFLLVRAITGNSIPGLISSIFFAVSPAIIQRGNLGWFKSEPLGIFYGLGGLYLFISALKENKYKFSIPKAIFSGIIVSLAMASWGGAQYFIIPIAIFIIILAFYSNKLNMKNSVLTAVLFTVSVMLVAMVFPRPGMSFITGPLGILLISSTAFLFISTLVKKITSDKRSNIKTVIVLGVFIMIGLSLITGGFYKTPSFRYLNAINPFISSQNKLVESVAEHFTPTIVDYFRQFSILLIFSGLGIWVAFKNKNNTTIIFALIIGFTGIYVSATFARLLVFASLSITILSSIGIYEVIRSISSIRKGPERKIYETNKNTIKTINKKSKYNEIYAYTGFAIVLIIMLAIPMVYDANTNWITSADVPTSIANGGTNYRLTTNDWIDALNWISKNTPQNSTIASWWDYGYWITTLGNRTSLADNATINQTKIATIAKMFISPEKEGFNIANELKADYILIYAVGQKLPGLDPSIKSPIYILGSGGDESKKHWFIRIGGFNESDYLESNGDTPKQKYWDSFLGKMMPFDTIGYFNPNSNTLNPTYQPNTIPFYVKDIKYPKGNTTGPLTLEYASKSFENNNPGLFFGVLLYKVNHEYKFNNNNNNNNNSSNINTSVNSNQTITNSSINSKNDSNSSLNSTGNASIINSSSSSLYNKNNISNTNSNTLTSNNMSLNKTAVIETTQGPIKIEFYPNVAPNHVKNFLDLAEKGFYDGIVFHRIVPGFVIQAGDPNTKNDSNRQNWGTGGPGYTINEEFNNISHDRGVLSMARTSDPNSAGSQFFIVLNDSKFLDNQYTVFGKVIQGMDIVDKIASTPTNSMDQPADSNSARITKIIIQ